MILRALKNMKKCKKSTVKKNKNFNFRFFDIEDALLEVLDYESTKMYYF